MKLISSYFVKTYIFVYLAGSMGLFAVLFVPQNSLTQAVGSSKVFMSFWIAAYCLSLVIVLIDKIKLLKSEIIIFFIPIFYLISTIWSIAPSKTFIYSVILMLNGLFVVIMRRYIKPQELAKTILYIILVMCLCGLIANVLGFESTDYLDIHGRKTILGTDPIRGLFNHKITAGYYAVIGILLSWYLLVGLTRILTIFIFFLFLLLTGSSAGLGLLFLALLAYLIINFSFKSKLSPKYFIALILCIVGLGFLLFMLVGKEVLLMLERDPTMTGRTLLWSWGIDVSIERFFTGWGYLGYNGTPASLFAASRFQEFANYNVPHFHNSYVQYLVEAGWFFGIVFICLYFKATATWYSFALKTNSKECKAILILLLNMIIAGGFIHILGRYNNFSMIIFLYALSYSFVHTRPEVQD
jgi:O-antigen ligase